MANVDKTSNLTELADGSTAATQSSSDNSTKLATTAYADAAGAGGDPVAFLTLAEYFANVDRLQNGTDGTGFSLFGNTGSNMSTGGDADSYANVRMTNVAFYTLFALDSDFSVLSEIVDTAGTDFQTFLGVGALIVSGSGITYTAPHYGFKVVRSSSGTTTLSATNANGTETATDTGITVTTGQMYLLTARKVGSEIKYYVDGVLKATHTTNIPSGSENTPLQLAISNVSTASTSSMKTAYASFRTVGAA